MPGMNTGGLLRAGVWWVLRVLVVFIEKLFDLVQHLKDSVQYAGSRRSDPLAPCT